MAHPTNLVFVRGIPSARIILRKDGKVTCKCVDKIWHSGKRNNFKQILEKIKKEVENI